MCTNKTRAGLVSYLVGDDIELLLVLALHVDGALDAREVGDGRALHQRGDLLARRGDAGQHDGHLVVDRAGALLLQQPRRERHDLVAARLGARLRRRRGRRGSVHGRHAPHVGGRRRLGGRHPAGPSEGEAASEGGRLLLAGEEEQVGGGGGGGGGHCCWWHGPEARVSALVVAIWRGWLLLCFFRVEVCVVSEGMWIGGRIVRTALSHHTFRL